MVAIVIQKVWGVAATAFRDLSVGSDTCEFQQAKPGLCFSGGSLLLTTRLLVLYYLLVTNCIMPYMLKLVP